MLLMTAKVSTRKIINLKKKIMSNGYNKKLTWLDYFNFIFILFKTFFFACISTQIVKIRYDIFL